MFYLKNIEHQEILVLGLYNILSNHKLQLSSRVYSQINKNLNHYMSVIRMKDNNQLTLLNMFQIDINEEDTSIDEGQRNVILTR